MFLRKFTATFTALSLSGIMLMAVNMSRAEAADGVLLDTLTNEIDSGFGFGTDYGFLKDTIGFGVVVPQSTTVRTVRALVGGDAAGIELLFYDYEPANSATTDTPFLGLIPKGSMGHPVVDENHIGTFSGSVTLRPGKYFLAFRSTSFASVAVIRVANLAPTGPWSFASENPGTVRGNYYYMFDGTFAPAISVSGEQAANYGHSDKTSPPGERARTNFSDDPSGQKPKKK